MDADGFFTLDSGALMPAVGFGTWQAVDGKGKDAVLTALSVGYRSLDCAHLYGNERDVGEALKEAFSGAVPGLKREDVFLTSKLWCTNSSPKRVAQACERSLKNLGTSYLDLFLLHWPIATAVPDATDPPPGAERRPRASGSIRATWQAMEALVDAGHVRAIGLSNFSIRQIEDLLAYAKIVPSVNQVELHPLWRQEELLKYCQQLGIHVSAHTPLGTPGRVCHVSPRMGSPAGPAASQGGGSAAAPGGDSADGGGSGDEANSNGNGNGIRGKSSSSGFGSGSTSGSGAGSRSGRKSVSVYAPMLKDSVVVGLAEKYRKTPAQILLRWGVQRGTSVLPRSVRPERIRSNFEVLGWELAPADWELVNSMEPQQCLIDGTYSYLAENWPFHALVEEDEELDLKETLAGDGGAPAPGGAANGSTPMGPAASQAAAAVAGAEAAIDVHPDGSRFATAGHDHKIRVWSMLPFAEWTDTGGGGEGVSEEANGSSTKPKLLATLCNHTGPVNCVRWSHQGRHVASASDDQLVLVHERRQGRGTATFGSGEAADVENWKVILTLRGHTSDVIDVAWSPDDAFIASCSLDNTVRIWQAGGGAGGAPVATLSDHRSFVKGVAWDPIDAFVASQSDDKSVLLWRTGDWKLAARVEGPFDKTVGATFFRRLAWSPCGSHLTTTHAFNAPQHTAAVIDRGTWVKGFDFVGHVAPVVAVRYNHRAFCPPPPPPPPPDNSPAKTAVNGDTAGENGELPPAKRARAAEQYNCVAMGSQDCRLSVWTTNRPRPVLIGKHFFTQPVVDLAWSPDGYTLLCCSTDGSVAAFVFTPQELGVMCSPADMDRIKRDRYGDTRVRHVAVAESPALLALEHAAAERLKPAPPPPASAGVVADAPSEVRRPLPPAGPPAATAARSGPSSCAAAAAAGGLAGTAGVDANAGAGASASARHQAAEAPAPPPPPPPPLPSKLPGGSSSSSPARQGVVQQVVEMRADGRRRIVPQPLAVPGGPSAADASHPFGMPAAAGRPPQEPPVAPPPVVGEVGEKRVAAAAALDAHADDDKRRRLSDAPAPPAVAAGHVQLPSRGAGSGAPPVVVAPHRARGEGVLTVHFKPDARDAAQLPTVLEARSGDSDSAGTHVTCSRGGQVMWRDHVAGAAAAAVAGNGKLWAVGMADGALQVYTFHGRRALPLLLLGAAAVVLECDGAWRLLAITAAGDVQLWDLHPSRRARLLKDSVAPLLLRSPDQKLEIASARISRAGAPVVVLSNRHAFMFHLALGTWLQVAHHSFAASQFASVWPTPAHSSDGELASLQAGLAGARGAYGGGAQLTALLDRGRADEKQQTRAHAEDLLAAAEVLQSPHEYRRHLVSYVRVLTKEGDEVRLRELCEHFLGRPSASPSLDEHATILGMSKRELLQKDILPTIAANRAVQRLLNEFLDLLADAEAEDA